MLDFTSALYLNMQHASRDLPAWEQLTLGKPAALEPPPFASQVQSKLAALTGCEQALIVPSTLHLFWDLFTMLAGLRATVFLDNGSYPILRWGVERAASLGMPVCSFERHSVDALRRRLQRLGNRLPVIVADGYYPSCGRFAPLPDYVALARKHRGLVVIDDTQAMGIFGIPGVGSPYGSGGGGAMRHWQMSGREPVALCASMAKAFGAPLAFVAGGQSLVDRLERCSSTRVHCSPPSVAVIAAADHALTLNAQWGDRLRRSLFRNVQQFRHAIRRLGLSSSGGDFPVQTLELPDTVDPAGIAGRLQQDGVAALVHRPEAARRVRLSFIVTARHTPEQIEQACQRLKSALTREWAHNQEGSYAL